MWRVRLLTVILLLGAPLLPAYADGGSWYAPLRESFDPRLQAGLEGALEALGVERAVARKRLAVVLADLTDLREPRLAEVNGDEMFYAASLPKLAILLGAFVQIERGAMRLDRVTSETLTRMVRVSSNRAATRMLNRVGRRRVLEILQSERFRLYDPLVNGGLWVGKEYGKGTAYQRDPLHHLSHAATAMQTARFYYLLATGRLVAPALSRRMKAMLGDPGINHKFVRGLAGLPGVRIYRKSGTWRGWHADSALVEAGRYRYIAVALAHDPRGGQWMTRMIRPLHRLIVPTKVARISP